MATKTLRVTLADILGPAGPAGRVSGEVWAVFVDGNGSPRQIRYTDGTVVVPAAPRRSLDSSGVVDFVIVPNDDSTIHVDDRGFGVKVGWDLTVRGERGAKVAVKSAGTVVSVVTADPAVVQFGLKAPFVPVIPGATYLTTGTGDARYLQPATAAATYETKTVVASKRAKTDLPSVLDYGAVGNGVADDTDAFNAAITANPGRTIFAPKGTYLIDPIKNTGLVGYGVGIKLNQAGTTLQLDAGATLQAKTNSAVRYSVVEMTSPDTAITGGAIVGDLTTHTGGTGEWGYCIQVGPAADRARIEDMRLSDAWGDCVMVGDGGSFGSGVLVKDVLIRNVTMDRARRNNLSVVACKDIRVIGCSFTRAGTVSGTAPKAGVDVEPNPGGLQDVINATFIGCTFADNGSHGFGVHAQGRTVSASVQGCTSRGNASHGYALTSTCSVEFYNCLASSNVGSGFTPDSYTGRSSAFVNCRALSNGNLGFGLGTGVQAVGCVAEDNTSGGFYLGGTARATGCVGRANKGAYYADFSVESGTGVVMTGCHADAGGVAPFSARGYRIFAGVTGTVLTGCSVSGAFGAVGYSDSGTGTLANPVPGKAVGFSGATTGTTAPAAGGAGALPATPLGYYTVSINGTDRKVAYY